MNEQTRQQKNSLNMKTFEFDTIRISVSGPEQILERSRGEVLKPETINYRTQKPERDGLFDERIFGPTKDWECYCGKYKKIRYKGIICDKCGVEVTRSSVRRERMGHISLAVPIAHIWYVRGIPSIMSVVLDISVADLEKVIYFAGYIVLEVNEDIRKSVLDQLEKEFKEYKHAPNKPEKSETEDNLELTYRQLRSEAEGLKVKKIIPEGKYHEISMRYGQIIRVGIGAEAIYELFKKMDLDDEIKKLEEIIKGSVGVQKRRELRRMKMLMEMKKNEILPEWLILTQLPVIPPDLRPMVQLDGGRFAASDLNDLYRRVINRNNRLKRLISQGAPEVICRNEKRMLQEAVDSLIDNSSRRSKAVTTSTQRKLRSLSDMLRGKQGRFRQNLLGKRVDYSGRSVIVVGPELRLQQCGLPKVMALELFKPFVISKMISEGHVHNVKNAQKLIEKSESIVWDILEQITDRQFVLLNRAPTLHRLGIQAFKPVLIEGKAIQIHPLVCQAYNADFDGDQMAVHVPLSKQAVWEAENLMWSRNNVLKPASGDPIISPRLDIVMGCYYLTSFAPGAKGEGKIFSSKNEAVLAYQSENIDVRAKIKVRLNPEKAHTTTERKKKNEIETKQIIETSIGRVLLNNLLPEEMEYKNLVMDNKTLRGIIKECFKKFGTQKTVELVDKIKNLGFEYATLSGLTISIDDIQVPDTKDEIIKKGDGLLEEIEKQYRKGLITAEEKKIKTTELWLKIKSEIEKQMLKELNPENSVYMMMSSGARGSLAQITQMAGMKGLMVNPAGEIIEIPIKSNFKEGLSVFEYFISTHGARKGRSDTALRTSDAGYLTRRLVDAAQDIIVSERDCETNGGILITKTDSEEIGEKFSTRIAGRLTAEKIRDPQTKKDILKANEEITDEIAKQIEESEISEVKVRSVLTCESDWGICQNCYGRDLANGKLVKVGEAVGVIAAQAIGEPGTQLTLKTFHMGGITGEDITTGLPRVEELFEARAPKKIAILAEIDGKITIKDQKDEKIIYVVSDKVESETYKIPSDYKITIKNHETIKIKQVLALAPEKKSIRSSISGEAEIKKDEIIIKSKDNVYREYHVPANIDVKVKNNEMVKVGQELTEGNLDLARALKLKGKEELQRYIIKEVLIIYLSQGQTIHDKHAEVIIRQMFSKVRIISGGDSEFLEGQAVSKYEFNKANAKLKKSEKELAKGEELILGLTRIALETDSFLSAASFQETTGVLINAAVKGAQDYLRGLKENVIIGKTIPTGTSFRKPIA